MDADPAIVDRAEVDALFDALRDRGYTVVGPTVRSQSLVYDELAGADDLPAGWARPRRHACATSSSGRVTSASASRCSRASCNAHRRRQRRAAAACAAATRAIGTRKGEQLT